MKCRNENFWRAFLDSDSPLDPGVRNDAADHLNECPRCLGMTETLKANMEPAAAALAPAGQPDMDGARRRFETAAGRVENRLSAAAWRPIAAAASVALALVAMATVPPVRSIAADLLQLFRAEKFEAVGIDPQAMMNFDPSQLGDFDMEEPTHHEVGSAAEAAKVTGLPVSEPADLPPGLGTPIINAGTGAKLSLTFNLTRFNSYLAENNIEGIELPPSIDGQTVIGRMPPVVMMEFDPLGRNQPGGGGQPELVVAQAGLPTVEAPPGVDADELRNQLLKLPVFPPAVREQLAALSDWKRTLPIPYPADEASSEKVTVDGGRDGLYFTAKDGTNILIWTDGAKAYGLIAPTGSRLSRADLFKIAGSLK